jgi:hypothetical protein
MYTVGSVKVYKFNVCEFRMKSGTSESQCTAEEFSDAHPLDHIHAAAGLGAASLARRHVRKDILAAV